MITDMLYIRNCSIGIAKDSYKQIERVQLQAHSRLCSVGNKHLKSLSQEYRLLSFRQNVALVWAFSVTAVCRTLDCQCSGLMTRNRMRFISHGAVALCKGLQKTGRWLRLASDSRYECLIDELHSFADNSLAIDGYKGSLTTCGLLLPKYIGE